MKRLILLIALIAMVYLWIGTDLSTSVSLGELRQLVQTNPLHAAAWLFGVYVLVTALSLPAAALLTLTSGAVFGFGWGLLLASFASSIGATLAFLVSRTLLRDWVQQRFGRYLEGINRGVEKDGVFYLFSLRLIPVVPFFVINLVFGITSIKVWPFYWVSQLGMLAGTAVYVNAGAELGALEELSVSGIMTPGVLGALLLLATFPHLMRAMMSRFQQLRIYRPFNRPKQFDANLVVIGGGSAGLVSALIAATVKAKVVLIERDKMGGDCLNTGCVPSKALIRSARVAHTVNRADQFGLLPNAAEVDFPQVIERLEQIIKRIEPHDSVERYTELGVECVTGDARITSPWEVTVGSRTIRTRNIIIAAGASPVVPQIAGMDTIDYVTSDSVWQKRDLPQRLLVVGGGPIGCELAQAFSRLGSEVAVITRAGQIMPKEDEEVAAYIQSRFQKEGIRVLSGYEIDSFQGDKELANQVAKLRSKQGDEETIAFDRVLLALGRQARSEQFSDLELPLTESGTLQVDEYLRTPYHNIYAAGDIIGPFQFTHMASHQAWYAAVNALFGGFKKFKVDYRLTPWATFTDPQVARVGISEREAQAQGLDVEVTRYDLDDLDRAIADGETQGFIKVITKGSSDRILGVTIVGYHAGELIAEWVLAMKYGLGLNKILATIHIYPTLSEANKFVAGSWKKRHVPQKLLLWVERYHRLRRR